MGSTTIYPAARKISLKSLSIDQVGTKFGTHERYFTLSKMLRYNLSEPFGKKLRYLTNN